jgi:hypothetical protein
VHVEMHVVFSGATRTNDVYHSLEIGSDSMHLPSKMFSLKAHVAERAIRLIEMSVRRFR